MSNSIAERLRQLGISLPKPAAPAGAYVPWVIAERLLFVSGQLPIADGAIRYQGRIGSELTVEDGVAAARLCAINLLAQAADATEGDLGRIQRVVRLGGFVLAAPGFTDHPRVLNGASDLMQDVFGHAGRHARFAVGAASLPFGVAVEVEAIFAIAG